ncbi:hypothetical protein EPUS_05659 [Endocarpon pusillum Z07020]|uniref:Uncharacterized protein n=1 Tax=Endocarpon pusillum (strain Z07020 / HMAS-L-300199) TaxID=1263415 RepID=U1HEM9_ENDPU|nr:uncharacterized protein EPUS_05659 [Endocarpon pusillum Z07020]ERF68520.1 hypothetical protein EPUS_05659 [Endocarpon pusillum Z07020]
MGDPFSIVAGAAGIVSLGLTVCSGLLEYYGSWQDSASDVVTMCESLEALTKTFQLLDEKVRHPLLDRASVDRVTESIISCAAGVQKLKSKLDKIRDVKPGMSAHLQRAQYPFRQKTLMALHQTISDLRSNLGLAASTLQLDISVTSFHRLNELDTKVKNLIDTSGISSTKVLDGISELRLAQKEEKLKSISEEEREAIHWLSPLDFASKHADAVSRRQQGTGRWLLESSEFRSWIQTPGKVLWCPGIPGAGKTILTSTVIDHLEEQHKRRRVAVAYVYCVYNGAQQTAASLLGSLLKQLALQDNAIMDDIKSCQKQHVRCGTRPSLHEISALLRSQVRNFDEVFIIIDALDECPEADQVRNNFLNGVRSLLPHIQLMVTSRPIASIESMFKEDTQLEIRAHDEDIRTFIESHIQLQKELVDVLEGHDDVQSVIVSTLLEKTNGMFLLAALHMESLSKEDNIRDIRESLRKLPEDLDDLYDEALQRIKCQDRRKAARADQVLTLINCAFRPLTMEEVRQALSIRPDDTVLDVEAMPRVDSLLSACCGLVVVEDESQIVRLVHYTAEEYFARIHQYRGPEAHWNIAGTLITYLSFTTFATYSPSNDSKNDKSIHSNDDVNPKREEIVEQTIALPFKKADSRDVIRQLIKGNILLRYTMENWGNHTREAVASFSQEDFKGLLFSRSATTKIHSNHVKSIWDLKQILQKLLQNKANIRCANDVLYRVERWSYFFRPRFQFPVDPTYLHIAAAFGIQYLVRDCLQQGADIDAWDASGTTALHRAAANGHVEVVQLLLDSNCSIDLRDAYGRTALHWSVEAARVSVVHLLLQRGSRPPKSTRGRSNTSPFTIAAERGHREIVVLLAEHETNQAERDEEMGKALQVAASLGNDGIVSLLLQEGNSWHIPKKYVKSAMLTAARANRLIIIPRLLKAGVDVNAFSGSSRTPLGEASRYGRLEAVQLLLEAGADVNIKDKYGDRPLHGASSVDVVVLLLERGADIDALGQHNQSVMVRVANKRWEDKGAEIMMQRLLEMGANLTAQDDFGRTALDYSVLDGNKSLAELLLRYDNLDVTRRNSMLRLATLYHAIIHHSIEATDQLLAEEELPCLESISELLLLHMPAQYGHEQAVRIFLKLGAGVEDRDSRGKTALHLASMEGHTAIVQLLLNWNADVNALTREGYTPLILSTRIPNRAIAEILMNRGADLNICGRELGKAHGTALVWAVKFKRMAMIKLLIKRGADMNIGQLHGGGTILHVAAYSYAYTPSCVELLIEEGADLESRDELGRTPLAVAARVGNTILVQPLLDKGADLESRDNLGQTPLVLAVRNCRVAIVHLLLDRGADPRALPSDVAPEDRDAIDVNFNRAVKMVVRRRSSC